MAYTRKDAPVGQNGGPTVRLTGGQVNDSNRIAVQGVANGINTNDAAPTPVTSPVVATATADVVLTVPQSAISVTIVPATAAATVSEVAGSAQNAVLPVGTVTTINLAKQKYLYLRGSGASSTVSFYFSLID